jgi:hypothetical protein
MSCPCMHNPQDPFLRTTRLALVMTKQLAGWLRAYIEPMKRISGQNEAR